MTFVFNSLLINAETAYELKAKKLFFDEIIKRCKNIFNDNPEKTTVIFKETPSFENSDYYEIEISKNNIIFKGKTIRSFIFAYSHFLRKCEIYKNEIVLIKDISGKYSPKKKVRGHQIGYRTTPNTYDAWDYEQYSRYYLDMMAFTSNTVEHIPYEKGYSNRNRLMKYDEEEFLIEASRMADELDLDVSLWHPNNNNETEEEALKLREELYKKIPRLDILFIPGGDPGELPAEEFIERGKKISSILKKYHKNALFFPSAQAPHSIENWGDELIKKLKYEPEEIDGIIIGPNKAFPMHELRQKTPIKYPLRFYPDITHNLRCEYPVHFLNDDWHYAFSSTIGREGINPRPEEFKMLHRLYSSYTIGSVSYSEGVHDDLNKMVWSLLEFDSELSLNECVEDYVRFFMFNADTEKLKNCIFGLEKNWCGNPLTNPSIDYTYNSFCELKKAYPELSENYRFMLLYFRACCDKLVLSRMSFEEKLIEEAKYYLKKYDIEKAEKALNTSFPEPYNALRKEIFKLGEILFDLIGIQLDVENYCADNSERGAMLDTIDKPITDKLWLLNRIAFLKELPENEKHPFIHRLLNRNTVSENEYYYSVALHELTSLGITQDYDFYMDFQGDRDENNGTLPVSMCKVFDHYTFKARLGGLYNDTDYCLTICFKKRNTKNKTAFKIKANDTIIYSGELFGGVKEETFTKDLIPENYECRSYLIPENALKNGTLDLFLEEKTRGFELCEFWVKSIKD